MRHALPFRDTYFLDQFRTWLFSFEKDQHDDFRELVVPVLSAPTLYGKVLEALYNQNTMYIDQYVRERFQKPPPVGVRQHVRLLELRASEYEPSMLGFLGKFSNPSRPSITSKPSISTSTETSTEMVNSRLRYSTRLR
jgi:hypothetical protein